MCSNVGCVTYGTNQLRRCKTTGIGVQPWWAYDQDGNVLECGLCGYNLHVTRLSNDEAQFATGEIDLTPKVIKAFGADRLAAAERVRPLFQDHYSGLAEVNNNYELYSEGVIGAEKVMCVTNRYRTKTLVMLHDEYPFIEW